MWHSNENSRNSYILDWGPMVPFRLLCYGPVSWWNCGKLWNCGAVSVGNLNNLVGGALGNFWTEHPVPFYRPGFKIQNPFSKLVFRFHTGVSVKSISILRPFGTKIVKIKRGSSSSLVKIFTHFQTKTTQKPYLESLYKGVPHQKLTFPVSGLL